jgi:hypothetical protein
MDHGQFPHAYFNIEILYEMFNYLTEQGYTIIYKRPSMKEFTIDENEMQTVYNKLDISANVDGLGLINDYKLTEYYDDVILLDDIIKKYPNLNYNEIQLKVFANVDNFISIAGGNSIFCSYFGGTQVTYVTTSNELRPGYYDGDSYTKKLGNAKIFPLIDPEKEIIERGFNDYKPLIHKIKEVF